MPHNPPRSFSLRPIRILACVLVLVASTMCTHNSSSAYQLSPQSFPGVQIIPTRAGGFSVRFLSGMLPQGQPLYVIDGNRTIVDPVRGIDWLQQSDLISISVLKDPVDLAIYGQSGANGVILITTKQSLKSLK